MNHQEKKYLLNHQISSKNLNNYFPYTKKTLSKCRSNTFNFNKVNPSANIDSPKYIQNSRNFSNPTSLLSINSNSAVNLNKINIQKNNQLNINNLDCKYSASTLSLNAHHSNLFSPLPKKMKKNQKYQNLNSIKISINECNKNNSLLLTKKLNKKKSLILDLDETLVHSAFNGFNRKSDIILNINIDGKEHIIHVLKRPFLDYFLKEISKYYDIIIFTASISQYASPLIDNLDNQRLLRGRLYRQNCIFRNGLYIKDLKQIGKHLKDIIIIDNNPASYSINQDNGLPILTWYEDINDNELNKLIPLLKYLSNVDDVRKIIKKVVNKEKNEIDFDLVDNIIYNNKNDENSNNMLINNGGIQNLNYNLYTNNINNDIINNNYDDNKYDINIQNINNDYNNNIDNEKENEFRNYSDNGNNEFNNNVHKYNEIIDSLSNMTYDEIQNEGHLDTNNTKDSESINIDINNEINKVISNNFIERKVEILNKSNNKEQYLEKNVNILSYRFTNDNLKNDNKRSFTPNINIKRQSKYDEGINSLKNNVKLINEEERNSVKIKNKNLNINDMNIKHSNKNIINRNNDEFKMNNYIENNDNINDINTFQISQKILINQRKKEKKRIHKEINNKKRNNIKNNENYENKNINSNLNTNNINKRNNNTKDIRIGLNYNKFNRDLNNNKNNLNTINNIDIIRNDINLNNHQKKSNINSNNIIIIKSNINSDFRNRTINGNNSIINNIDDENEKARLTIEFRREKLNEIKKKMEEINKDIIYAEKHLFQTQNNFLPNNKNKNKLNLLENDNYKISNNNKDGKTNFIKKIKKNNNEKKDNQNSNNNTFNKSFSVKKNLVSNDNALRNISPYSR